MIFGRILPIIFSLIAPTVTRAAGDFPSPRSCGGVVEGAPVIGDVSDTAFWVATYREQETLRPDALFRDPFAARLAGARGHQIAARMSGSRYTSWALAIRTVIIDSYIRDLIANEGIDTVVNLGAGLDARPYRMDLPPALHWIEGDLPQLTDYKNATLRDQKPHCRLERVSIDLGDRSARKKFLDRIAQPNSRVLVLTEGVIPYLTSAQVAELAEDLHSRPAFAFWIADYYSPQAMLHMRYRRNKEMGEATMKFAPPDWFGFFEDHGWKARDTRFLNQESMRLGRPVPIPRWLNFLGFVVGKDHVAQVLLTPK